MPVRPTDRQKYPDHIEVGLAESKGDCGSVEFVSSAKLMHYGLRNEGPD